MVKRTDVITRLDIKGSLDLEQRPADRDVSLGLITVSGHLQILFAKIRQGQGHLISMPAGPQGLIGQPLNLFPQGILAFLGPVQIVGAFRWCDHHNG
ncbi:hypothetical protein [Phyllobacterium brassicacearum]|uniref:hypothetical protein n=1 Tax=Phyllobacterium brassicacearum TaxID=314235 RepID=UPI001060FC33|nr:hypothetical protein [Phyllobacterium brassicacearum]